MPDLSHLPEVDDTEKGTDWQSSLKDVGGKAAEAVKDLIDRESKDKGKNQDKDDGDKSDPKTPAEPRASEIPKIGVPPPPTPSAPDRVNPATLVVGGLALLAVILLLLRRR